MPNPNENFMSRIGRPIRVLLSKKPQSLVQPSGGGSTVPASSVSRRRRPDDELFTVKKGGLINFYDLGQVMVADEWVDLGFSIAPTPSVDGNFVAFSSTDWEDFWDLIFTTPVTDWVTTYKKLGYEEAEKYGLQFTDNVAGQTYQIARNGSNVGNNPPDPVTGTKWTSQGLKLDTVSSDIQLESGAFGAFMNWSTASSVTKITSVYDYTASAVSLNLNKKNTNIFLAPKITATNMYSNDGMGQAEIVVYPYKSLPRSFFLNRVYDVSPYPLYTFGGGLDLSSSDKTDLQDLIENDPDSRRYDTAGGYGGSPTSYPTYSLGHEIDVNHVGASGVPVPFVYAGTLRAVIQQGSTFYYVWATETTSIVNGRDITL